MDLQNAAAERLGPDAAYTSALDYAVDPAKAGAFAASVSRFWPGVTADALLPDQSGIRPKLSAANEPWRDFVVQEESARGLAGWVNLVGIESPGLTASPALAELTAGLLGA